MHLFEKHISLIEPNDILRLIENEVSENKVLEFKSGLSLSDKNDKKEFLFDIAAMANTDGGLIIFGIEEKKDESGKSTGVAENLVDILQNQNQDQLLLTIQNMIRDGIDPSVNPEVRILEVEQKKILLIGIKKFTSFPHMVTNSGANKFYRRNSNGKYPVDVAELNDLFIQNTNLQDKIRSFVEERIKYVISKEFLTPLDISNPVFLHIIPISCFFNHFIDFADAEHSQKITSKLYDIQSKSNSPKLHNFEGLMINHTIGTEVRAHCQLFRNGIIEVYDSQFIHYPYGNQKIMFGDELEEAVKDAIIQSFRLFDFLKLEPPYAIYLNLLNTRNISLTQNPAVVRRTPKAFGRNQIQLPPVIVHSKEENMKETLRSIFNIIWQTAGFSQSPC
jgi:hypothetical protein